MKFVFQTNGERYIVISQGWQKSHHFVIGCTQRNEETGKLRQLYTGVHGEPLAIQLFRVTAKLLVTRISPNYLGQSL